MTIEHFWSPIFISIQVSLVASLFVLFFGVLIGRMMSRKLFKEKAILETLFMLPLVLPPSVIGFGLIVFFGRNSVVGQAIEWVFNQPLIFTWWAAVIAASIVSFPLMYQSVKTGFELVDREIEEAAMMDGANTWQIFWKVTIPLAKHSIVSGFILSFARALGEFGATLMFAGNIPGKTQTVSTAIYIAVESGDYTLAWLWVSSIVMLSYLLLFLVLFRPKNK